MVIADYEHVTHLTKPDWMIFPEVIPEAVTGRLSRHVLRYPGIKEDVYAVSFTPDPALASALDIAAAVIVTTVRPPATEAHYHHQESDELFTAAMERLLADERTRVVLLPRNQRQKADLATRFAQAIAARKVIVPAHAVDGLHLVWLSDLVVSGGGTMNREAAALGVPVYSTFRGRRARWTAGWRRRIASSCSSRPPTCERGLSWPSGIEVAAPVAGRAALEAIVAHIARVAGPRSVATTVLKTGDA